LQLLLVFGDLKEANRVHVRLNLIVVIFRKLVASDEFVQDASALGPNIETELKSLL